MRDPAKRYVSNYLYWKENKNYGGGFEDFLSIDEVHNWQIKKISGSQDLNEAKKKIEFDYGLVDYVEKFNEYMVAFGSSFYGDDFSLSKLCFQRENKTKDSGPAAELLEKYKDRIYEANFLDCELYQWLISDYWPKVGESYRVRRQSSLAGDAAKLQQLNLNYPPGNKESLLDYVFGKIILVEDFRWYQSAKWDAG